MTVMIKRGHNRKSTPSSEIQGVSGMGRRQWVYVAAGVLCGIATWRKRVVVPSAKEGFFVIDGWVLPASYFDSEQA